VPTWIDFLKSYLYSQPARLIDPRPNPRAIAEFSRGSGLSLRRATPEDIAQLPEFWGRWYSVSKTARCVTPLEYIQKAAGSASSPWDILVCVKGDSVVGSLVRRWVVGLHMREVRWPKAGLIDYFCIHPAYRSKGVGRALLSLLHNLTTPIMLPQLMMWEGIHPTIPPISAGLFMYKKCSSGVVVTAKKLTSADASSAWRAMQKGNEVWSEYSEAGEETSIWDLGGSGGSGGSVAIWNTFHRSVPEGLLIGIIVGATSASAAAAAAAAPLPFGILLMPSAVHNTWALSSEGWAIDSPYQWVSYNTQFGTINTQFPGLFL
jgi:hypothetical protein